MKNITEIIKNGFIPQEESQIEFDELANKLVEYVFLKFSLICRGFDSHYEIPSRLKLEKQEWKKSFYRQKITLLEVEFALTKLDGFKYPKPPQLAEFLEWRHQEPKDLGLPALEDAYRISVVMGSKFSDYQHECPKTHTVIKHAIEQIGAQNYRSMTEVMARKTFEHYYTLATKQFASGELKEIPRAIAEAPESHPSDRERSNAARLNAMQPMRVMGLDINYQK